MKYLRKFDSVSEMETVIASSTIGVLGVAYEGGNVVMENKPTPTPPPDPKAIPFYIEDISGSANTIQIKKTTPYIPDITIEKSTDGKTWETMGTTSTTAITATVPANGKLYLRCSVTTWAPGSSDYNYFNTASGNFNVGGNIMSLLYGSNFTGNETTFPSDSTYTFTRLFSGNTRIRSAEQLLLPATTLADSCYKSMFQGCTSLTAAPVLPATTLDQYCYNNMFNGCTSLTTAPVLPVTTLANFCYQYMFMGCTSLTTAPELPATTLADSCYYAMFQGCTSLTTAPELTATTLSKYCYNTMFKNCTNLNYIKCLATDISANACTTNWVQGVALTGTFVKAASMNEWAYATSSIPSGWTIQNAAE